MGPHWGSTQSDSLSRTLARSLVPQRGGKSVRMTIDWDIQPGTRVNRRALHAKFGGAWYGGIEPSGKTPNVLLFTSETAGKQFGYAFDGWHPDGTFHYTGDGQVGDQVMKDGNRAVRDHREAGRSLRLFEKDGTDVIYIGEFEVPDESYILLDEAPDVKKEQLRSVFVFRLRPVGEVFDVPELAAPSETLTLSVPLEANNVDQYVREREAAEPTVALRSEADLVKRYVSWLAIRRGATVVRQAIPTAGGRLMYTDVFVVETRELIEAKASSSREHMRAALGQILDYARYVDHSSLAVLVPSKPADEMVSLLIAHGVGSIWETEEKGDFDSTRVANARNSPVSSGPSPSPRP